MRQSIHHHYAQLTTVETAFIDAVFERSNAYAIASSMGVPLAGDDRMERAVEALARTVIESRPKAKPRIRIKAGRDTEVIAREKAAEAENDARLQDLADQ